MVKKPWNVARLDNSIRKAVARIPLDLPVAPRQLATVCSSLLVVASAVSQLSLSFHSLGAVQFTNIMDEDDNFDDIEDILQQEINAIDENTVGASRKEGAPGTHTMFRRKAPLNPRT